METLAVGGRKVAAELELKGSNNNGAQVLIERNSIKDVLPELHEVHQRTFGDYISYVDDTADPIRIVFVKHEMNVDEMIVLTAQLLKQAIRLHEERKHARTHRANPSNPDGLVVVNPDRYHKGPKRPFTNVPPRLRRR